MLGSRRNAMFFSRWAYAFVRGGVGIAAVQLPAFVHRQQEHHLKACGEGHPTNANLFILKCHLHSFTVRLLRSEVSSNYLCNYE